MSKETKRSDKINKRRRKAQAKLFPDISSDLQDAIHDYETAYHHWHMGSIVFDYITSDEKQGELWDERNRTQGDLFEAILAYGDARVKEGVA